MSSQKPSRVFETFDPALPLEVVFVDAGVADAETLVDGLRADGQQQTQWLVVELSGEEDGIDQISHPLSKLSGVDAVHLVSYGGGEGIELGSARLDNHSAAGYASQIASWADALDTDADLLIYGCDLASSHDGRALIESIAALCDCDVAASDDATGHEVLGGDWDLEYAVGEIESHLAFVDETDIVNNDPVLTLGSGEVTYFQSNSTGVFVDALAMVTDADDVDFDGGTLTTSISTNGTADDRLIVLHQGTRAGQVEVVGSSIRIDGTEIAKISGGVGVGDDLVITFDAGADVVDVEAVARRIAFVNVSEEPSGLQRTISMQITDGDGGSSSVATRAMNVQHSMTNGQK